MPDRILITGGAGFIGLHLARRLLRSGHEVVLVDDFSRGRDDLELREVAEHARMMSLDLAQPLPVDRLGKFDTIFHLAAAVGVAKALEEPNYVARVNLLTSLNLVEYCRREPPKRLFFSSTSEIADGARALELAPIATPEHAPVVLLDHLAPRSSYALSKLAGEMLMSHAAASGTAVSIGRYHNVYGPRMGDAHVIPQLIARVGEDPFRLFGPHQTRAFCYVDDAIEASIALTHATTPGDSIIVNIGNDQEEITIGALARMLFEIVDVDPEIDVRDATTGSPERRRPDLRKLHSIVGFEPQFSLSEGLKRTVDWYRPELIESGQGSALGCA